MKPELPQWLKADRSGSKNDRRVKPADTGQRTNKDHLGYQTDSRSITSKISTINELLSRRAELSDNTSVLDHLWSDKHLIKQDIFDAIDSGKRIFIFGGNPGSGKSTVISNLAYAIKTNYPKMTIAFSGEEAAIHTRLFHLHKDVSVTKNWNSDDWLEVNKIYRNQFFMQFNKVKEFDGIVLDESLIYNHRSTYFLSHLKHSYPGQYQVYFINPHPAIPEKAIKIRDRILETDGLEIFNLLKTEYSIHFPNLPQTDKNARLLKEWYMRQAPSERILSAFDTTDPSMNQFFSDFPETELDYSVLPPRDTHHYIRENEMPLWLARNAYFDAYLHTVLKLTDEEAHVVFNGIVSQNIVYQTINPKSINHLDVI